MASLSETCSTTNPKSPKNDENKEETTENTEAKSDTLEQPDNKTVDLFGKPVTICNPFGAQNSYKPVFGNNRSILKPSTLFADANASTQSVTFGNSTNKTVKLKPSVLANPFISSESNTKNESKSDCDETSEGLPSTAEEASSSDKKEESVGSTSSTSVHFVPLNVPSTPAPVASTGTTSSAATSSSPQSEETTSNTSSAAVSTAFVFGQNIHERVTQIENDKNQEPVTQNGDSSTEMLFSSAIKQESTNSKQKDNSVSHEFSNGNAKTLSDSAKEYEEARSVKRKYEEVAVVTGEEDEQNVLQINCKLFAFDNASSSWAERGRGTLRVNDKEGSDGRSSRLVMRLLGNHRVVLNTKIWSDMSVDLASKKSVRLTAIDNDGQVRIYLVMASPKDSEQLYNVLSTRIQIQKKKLKVSSEESTSNNNLNPV